MSSRGGGRLRRGGGEKKGEGEEEGGEEPTNQNQKRRIEIDSQMTQIWSYHTSRGL